MNNNESIQNLDVAELKQILTIEANKYTMSVGQNISDYDLKYFVEVAFKKVTESNYKNFDIWKLKNVFKSALEDIELKQTKLTYRNFLIWLSMAHARYMKYEANNHTDYADVALTPEEKKDGLLFAEALEFKLNNIGEGKRYSKNRWREAPLSTIKEMIERGENPHVLFL